MTVTFQEKSDGQKGRALVAIVKWMITGEAETVCGCQSRHVRFGFVVVKVLWAGQGRVESARIAQSGQAAMFGESFSL